MFIFASLAFMLDILFNGVVLNIFVRYRVSCRYLVSLCTSLFSTVSLTAQFVACGPTIRCVPGLRSLDGSSEHQYSTRLEDNSPISRSLLPRILTQSFTSRMFYTALSYIRLCTSLSLRGCVVPI